MTEAWGQLWLQHGSIHDWSMTASLPKARQHAWLKHGSIHVWSMRAFMREACAFMEQRTCVHIHQMKLSLLSSGSRSLLRKLDFLWLRFLRVTLTLTSKNSKNLLQWPITGVPEFASFHCKHASRCCSGSVAYFSGMWDQTSVLFDQYSQGQLDAIHGMLMVSVNEARFLFRVILLSQSSSPVRACMCACTHTCACAHVHTPDVLRTLALKSLAAALNDSRYRATPRQWLKVGQHWKEDLLWRARILSCVGIHNGWDEALHAGGIVHEPLTTTLACDSSNWLKHAYMHRAHVKHDWSNACVGEHTYMHGSAWFETIISLIACSTAQKINFSRRWAKLEQMHGRKVWSNCKHRLTFAAYPYRINDLFTCC